MADPTMKFRSLQEVKRYLDEQSQQLKEDFAVVDLGLKKLQGMAAKALKAQKIQALEIKVMDFSGDGKPKKRRTIDTNFPVVDVPNKEVLQKNYREAEKLSQQYKALVQNETEVRMTFRNATNANFTALMSNFTKLKADIEKKLRELFTALSQVAEGHAPKEYKAFVKGLADELNEKQHLDCESTSSFTYVGLTKTNELIFAGYIVLKNAVSDEGKLVPHLYVAVRWVVSGEDAGTVAIYVEHDFVEPGLLTGGLVVNSLKDAVRAIVNQLALEGFSSQIGNLPINMQLKDPGRLNRDALNPRGLVKTIEVEEDTIIFHLNNHDIEIAKEIGNQLYLELKSMLRNKRTAKLRMSFAPSGDSIKFTISNLDNSSGISPHDLDFLKDKYGLSDQTLRRVANEINNGG